MGRRFRQSRLIENRSGADGNISSDVVANATLDGYTLLIVANGMAQNKSIYGKLNFDPVNSFASVSLIALMPNLLVSESLIRTSIKAINVTVPKS